MLLDTHVTQETKSQQVYNSVQWGGFTRLTFGLTERRQLKWFDWSD